MCNIISIDYMCYRCWYQFLISTSRALGQSANSRDGQATLGAIIKLHFDDALLNYFRVEFHDGGGEWRFRRYIRCHTIKWTLSSTVGLMNDTALIYKSRHLDEESSVIPAIRVLILADCTLQCSKFFSW